MYLYVGERYVRTSVRFTPKEHILNYRSIIFPSITKIVVHKSKLEINTLTISAPYDNVAGSDWLDLQYGGTSTCDVKMSRD